MIIDCISDLHGDFPKLGQGDLLIVAGDLTGRDKKEEYFEFFQWASNQCYKKIVVIGGNHDTFLQETGCPLVNLGIFSYLCDSGTEFLGIKIWGTPWTKTFPGMNPRCKAFTKDTDEELLERYSNIPNDIDILVSHNPPYGILDGVHRLSRRKEDGDEHVGSKSLANIVLSRERLPNLKLHVFGHIHRHGGQMIEDGGVKFVNAAIMDEVYDPVNKPVRIIL